MKSVLQINLGPLHRPQAIAAFEEAVAGMKAGGLRRIEIPGSKPDLGFPLDRKERFTNELIFQGKDKVYK